MADGVVRGDVKIDGVAQAVNELRAVKSEMDKLGSAPPTVVKVDTSGVVQAAETTAQAIARITAAARSGAQATAADVAVIDKYLSELATKTSTVGSRTTQVWIDSLNKIKAAAAEAMPTTGLNKVADDAEAAAARVKLAATSMKTDIASMDVFQRQTASGGYWNTSTTPDAGRSVQNTAPGPMNSSIRQREEYQAQLAAERKAMKSVRDEHDAKMRADFASRVGVNPSDIAPPPPLSDESAQRLKESFERQRATFTAAATENAQKKARIVAEAEQRAAQAVPSMINGPMPNASAPSVVNPTVYKTAPQRAEDLAMRKMSTDTAMQSIEYAQYLERENAAYKAEISRVQRSAAAGGGGSSGRGGGGGRGRRPRTAQEDADDEARRAQREYNQALTQSNRTGRFGARMDTQKAREEAALVKELEANYRALGRAEAEEAARNAEADSTRVRPFKQTAQTQSRSILGVPAELAAPVSLAVGVGIGLKEVTDFQTLITTTGNQTNLTTDEIKLMSQTIRDIPNGSPDLKDLATGFKNVTDLGFGAADAVKISTEESKAATAAGSDQAAVMLAITSSMKDYNATADDVAKFTNTTVEAARLANSSFETWSETTRRATAIAAAYGVPLKDVDAALVALTRHGFNTAQANTQVAGLIQNIVAPTGAAQKRIDELSDKTGIDLTSDFSQKGLQSKGLPAILSDVQKATSGDEALIKGLIPALRGGQAALLLTTSATQDFTDALGLLGETVNGNLKPVDEGFARIQQTTGYKFGQFLKELKLTAIDVGAAFLPMANAILNVMNSIPAPVKTATAEVALLALGGKSLAIAMQFVSAEAVKMTGAISTTTGVTTAETTVLRQEIATLVAEGEALGFDTTQWLANAKARQTAMGTGGLGPSVAKNGASSVAVPVAVEAGEVAVASGFAGRIVAAVGTAAAAIGTVAVPLTLGIAVGKVIGDLTVRPIAQHISDQRAANDPSVKQIEDMIGAVGQAETPDQARTYAAYIQKQIDERVKFFDDQRKNQAGGFLHGTPLQGIANWAGVNADMDINALVSKFADERKKVDDALQAKLKGTDPKTNKPFDESDPKNAEVSDAEIATMTQHYEELYAKRNELLAKGANPALVNHVLFSDDFKQTDAQLKQAKQDLAEWQRQYDEVQKAAKNAQTFLDSFDPSKGIASLVKDAPKLADIVKNLDKFNSGNQSLNSLSNISSKFKEIQDAEDKARQTFDGYLLVLDESDRRVQVLDSLRSRIQTAVGAAQKRVDLGIGTDEDKEFLRQAPDIFGNIDKNISDLRSGNYVTDILGLAKNVPEYKKLDDMTRDTVARFGGGQVLEATIHTNVDEAKAQIQTLVDGPWTAYVHLKSVDDMNQNITNENNARNNDQYYGPNDASLITGQNAGSGKLPPGAPLNQGTSGFNQYQPLSYKEYQGIVPKNSPMYSEAVYMDLIRTSKQNNIDPRYLLSFVAQEGNYGTDQGEGSWQREANNPGGLKFANQPGAKKGPPAPANEGGNYAAFATLGDYFNAMASTIAGYDAFKVGDAAGTAGTWTRGAQGYADLSDAEKATVAGSKLDIYRQLRGGMPGGSSSSGAGPSGGPGDVAYPYGWGDPGNPDTPGSPSNRNRANWFSPLGDYKYTVTQNPFNPGGSHQNLGAYDLAAPTGTPVYASATGKVVESGYSKDGYGNTVVVDYGGGVQARYGHFVQPSDTKVGDLVKPGQEIGNVGSTGNSTGPHLHFEVTVNGKEVDPATVGFDFKGATGNGQIPSSVTSSTRTQANLPSVGTSNFTGPVADIFKMPTMYDASMQARILQNWTSQLTGPGDVGRLNSQTSAFGSYAQKYYESRPEFFENKPAADKVANESTLNFAIAYAQALVHARDATHDMTDDYQKLREVGGPIAENAIKWLGAQQKINQATEINRIAQQEIKSISDTEFDRNFARQAQDRDIAHTNLINSRLDENDDIKRANDKRAADRNIEDARTITDTGFRTRQRQIQTDTDTENTGYIPVERGFQDRQRALQFQQQVQATDLQNKLTDLQKSQQDTTFQRTAQEQLLERRAKAAPDIYTQSSISQNLALMHEDDLARKDANKKAIDDTNEQIRAEAKKANLDSYNLETEQIAAQRAHEDNLKRIDDRSKALNIEMDNESVRRTKEDRDRQRSYEDESVRIDKLRLANKRYDEDAAITLATQRGAEDEADARRKKTLQEVIDKNTEFIQGLQGYQTYLDGIQSEWQDIATFSGTTADNVNSFLGNFAALSGQPTLVTTIPKKAFGGIGGPGWTMVGENPDGSINRTTELVHAPGMQITPIGQLLTSATAPAILGGRASGGGNNISVPISVSINDTDDIVAQLHSAIDRKADQLRFEFNNKNNLLRKARGA